jgi:DNA-binding beta-propeller fold protein YncE
LRQTTAHEEVAMSARSALRTLGILFLFMLLFSPAPAAADTVATGPWVSGGPFVPGSSPPVTAIVNAVAASPAYAVDHTLFAATQSGLFRSQDGGGTWTLALALPAGSPDAGFTRVRFSPDYFADGTVFAVHYEPAGDSARLYRTMDRGATWQVISTFGARVHALAVSPAYATDQTLFAVMGEGLALHRSTSGGQTWQTFAFGPADDYFNGFGLAVSPAYATDRTLSATGFGSVRRSTDAGETWAEQGTYGPTFGIALSPGFATDRSAWTTYRLIEGPGDGTPESSVMRTQDAGAAWASSGAGLPGYYEPFVRTLAVSPNFGVDQSVFTALSGELLGTPDHNLFRSYDGGASWVDLGPAPGNPDVLDMVATYAGGEGLRVHLATPTGVWSYGGPLEQRLVNPGFETDAGWQFPVTSYSAGYSTAQHHTGARSARAGIVAPGVNVRSYSSVQQTVSIPADATAVTLTLWLYPLSGEGALPGLVAATPGELDAAAAGVNSPDAPAGDRQYVLLLNENGAVLKRLWWTRSNARAWQQQTFDLAAYAGRAVRVHVGVYNDGVGGATGLYVDDVTLTVVRPLPPPVGGTDYLPLVLAFATPEPAPIPTPEPIDWPTPEVVGSLDLGLRARGLAVDAAGAIVYVGMTDDAGLGVIGVVALDPLSLTQQIALGSASSSLNDVAVSDDGALVFAAEREAGTVAVTRPASGTVVARIPAGGLPNGLAFQKGKGYVANFGAGSVTVFDEKTFSVTNTLGGVGAGPALFAVEQGAGGVLPEIPGACCDRGRMIWLSAHDSDAVVTLLDGAPVATRTGITDAYGLAYDAAAQRLYVANRGPAHRITVIDVYRDRVAGFIDTGDKEPHVVGVNPDSGHLFAVFDDEVRVYATVDWSLVASLPVAAGADSRIAVDSVHDRVYVTAYEGRRLTAIQDRWAPWVLLESGQSGFPDLYALLPDGRPVARLTATDAENETLPVGSPSGRWIAYACNDGVVSHICVMSRDGSRPRMLTDGPVFDTSPTWSPDGTRIAFASYRGGKFDIYVLSLATGGVARITQADPSSIEESLSPDWSWANGRIAFSSNRDGGVEKIFTMKPDGSDVRQVTGNTPGETAGDGLPAWAPDGSRLGFNGQRGAGPLYTAAADGADVKPVLSSALDAVGPLWPLEDAIFFLGRPGSTGEWLVLRAAPDGSALARLTDGTGPALSIGWLPGR